MGRCGRRRLLGDREISDVGRREISDTSTFVSSVRLRLRSRRDFVVIVVPLNTHCNSIQSRGTPTQSRI